MRRNVWSQLFDKSINNQSLVSIVRFLSYYHMSSAELKDRGKSLDAENAKGKWFELGSYYGGRGLCGPPSRLPPLNVFKLSQSIYSEQETRSFGIISQSHTSPLSMMGAKTTKGRGLKHDALSRMSKTRTVLLCCDKDPGLQGSPRH